MVRSIDRGKIDIHGYIIKRPTSVFICLSYANSSHGIQSKKNHAQKTTPKREASPATQGFILSGSDEIRIKTLTCFACSVTNGNARKNADVISNPTSSSVNRNGVKVK